MKYTKPGANSKRDKQKQEETEGATVLETFKRIIPGKLSIFEREREIERIGGEVVDSFVFSLPWVGYPVLIPKRDDAVRRRLQMYLN